MAALIGVKELHAEAAAAALTETTFLPQPAHGCPPALHYLAQRLACLVEAYERIVQGHKCAGVVDLWLLWLLEDELKDYPTSALVAALYRRRLAGDEPDKAEWKKAAADAAAAAAAYAAYATATRERMRAKLLELL